MLCRPHAPHVFLVPQVTVVIFSQLCGQSSFHFYTSWPYCLFSGPYGRTLLKNWYKKDVLCSIHVNLSKHTIASTLSALGTIIDIPPHATVSKRTLNTDYSCLPPRFHYPSTTWHYHHTMPRLFVWLATILLSGLSYITLFSGIAAAAVPCTPDSNRWATNHSIQFQVAHPQQSRCCGSSTCFQLLPCPYHLTLQR